jgi:hypothetical protein
VAEIRRLRPGDEELVRRLGEERALTAATAERVLADPTVRFLVALEDGEPVGFALAYVLQRRRLPERSLFLYEIEVAEPFRQRPDARRASSSRSPATRPRWGCTDRPAGCRRRRPT